MPGRVDGETAALPECREPELALIGRKVRSPSSPQTKNLCLYTWITFRNDLGFRIKFRMDPDAGEFPKLGVLPASPPGLANCR